LQAGPDLEFSSMVNIIKPRSIPELSMTSFHSWNSWLPALCK
jgi:hypothetical protein